MRKLHLLLVAFIAFGAASLGASTPAVAAEALACTPAQIAYIQSQIAAVCGSRGGSASATCDGASITIHSITCGAAVEPAEPVLVADAEAGGV
jgi:hypothetical protein